MTVRGLSAADGGPVPSVGLRQRPPPPDVPPSAGFARLAGRVVAGGVPVTIRVVAEPGLDSTAIGFFGAAENTGAGHAST